VPQLENSLLEADVEGKNHGDNNKVSPIVNSYFDVIV